MLSKAKHLAKVSCIVPVRDLVPVGNSSGEINLPSEQPTLSYRVGASLRMTSRSLIFNFQFSIVYASGITRLNVIFCAISFLSSTSGRKLMW